MIRRRSYRQRSSAVDAQFEQLVNDHARAITTYARSVAGTSTIAEDAVQETFLRAWRHLDSFRGTGSREGWLLRICRNAIYDLEAKERRSVPAEDAMVVRLDHEPLGSDGVAAPFDIDELAGIQVSELLNHLPVLQREVVVLCAMLGYSYEAAAEVLDTPVGTVRSRLSRARHSLREHKLARYPPRVA